MEYLQTPDGHDSPVWKLQMTWAELELQLHVDNGVDMPKDPFLALKWREIRDKTRLWNYHHERLSASSSAFGCPQKYHRAANLLLNEQLEHRRVKQTPTPKSVLHSPPQYLVVQKGELTESTDQNQPEPHHPKSHQHLLLW